MEAKALKLMNSAEAKDDLVENVVKLNYRAESESFVDAKLARDTEVEDKESRTASGIARKIPRFANRWQRKVIENGGINRVICNSQDW